ncbi:unnamed protein product, partial [Allacma fusca]
MLEGGLNG